MERKLYMARSSFHTPTSFPMDDAAAAGRRKNPVPDFLSKSKILSLFTLFVLEGRIERWGGSRRQTPLMAQTYFEIHLDLFGCNQSIGKKVSVRSYEDWDQMIPIQTGTGYIAV